MLCILSVLTAGGDDPRLALIVGHDTNIFELGGLLGLHWSLGGFPADDAAPGGSLGFALLADHETGRHYVSVFYQVQTAGQVRGLLPLSLENPPAFQILPVPGCGNSVAESACPLGTFETVAKRALSGNR